ncbi:MAG: MarR family transcriptional regulator [Elusimicrobiota bacterium]|nr:MarR family transcriptional regulator [Elusimicrobiota bacterium]
MTLSTLESIFSGKSRIQLLRCLYESSSGLTGREAARRTGLSPQQAHKVLNELAALGIVELTIAAPAHLFTLNRRHWIVTDVARVIFESEKNWLDNLLRDLSRGLPASVKSLVLFGSAASGQLRGASDIDLLALIEDGKDKQQVLSYFTGRSPGALARCHYPLAPVVLTLKEFRGKYRQKDDFTRTVLKTGRVVYGKLMTEIL